MSYTTTCDRCLRKFLSYRTLQNHKLQKHGIAVGDVCFYSPSGEKLNTPKPARLYRGKTKQSYLEWLSCVVERINGAHHPKFPGRWFRIDMNQTPTCFFHHIMWKLEVPLYSVKKTKHLRQPLLSTDTIKYCFRVYDIQTIIALLSEQTEVNLRTQIAFVNDMEVDTDREQAPENIQDPIAALEAAKKRANTFKRSSPTSRSTVVVGEGEGRMTREFELQWWPKLYKTNFGKLTFRFFVEKIIV